MYVTSDTSKSYYQTADNQNGYGGMVYYTSETCGQISDSNIYTGCTSNYADSEIKYVVDSWKESQASSAIVARLITLTDLKDNLGYTIDEAAISINYVSSESTSGWIYGNYLYWTMSSNNDSFELWIMERNGDLFPNSPCREDALVRPVIVLPKSALTTE